MLSVNLNKKLILTLIHKTLISLGRNFLKSGGLILVNFFSVVGAI